LKKDLAGWIEAKGLKLKAFAALVGIPYQTVYGYVRGDRVAKDDFLQKAAEVLRIKREEILQTDAGALREAQAEYRVSPVVELMMPEELIQRLGKYVQEMRGADRARTNKLIDSIMECAEELRRKTNKVEIEK
jgi:transcriptional regulator with XRE-family HTH domain